MAIDLSSVNLWPRRHVIAMLAAMGCIALLPSRVSGADTWTEIRTRNFTVLANGSTGEARKLAWQLEQIRAALVKAIPWARVDLDRPVVVLAVNNEQKMRAIAPRFWEGPGDSKPVSVWSSGADRYYLAIRSDVQAEDKRNINPHMTAYFSYISLVVRQSLEVEMPFWFTRGLTGLLSNTIVRDSFLLVGSPIPWHVRYLQDGTRLRLSALVAATRDSREATGDNLYRFDAQAWAFVHFLMFDANGSRAAQMNEFFRLVSSGVAADLALAKALGNVEQLETAFITYINRGLFGYVELPVDGSAKKEAFAERVLPPVEAASVLALFHTAMRRPVEARAAIAEARKIDERAADTYLAEALLLNSEGNRENARTALARAVAEGTTSGYAYYELARMQSQGTADRSALLEREKLLLRATELNPRSPSALSLLADVRSALGGPDAIEIAARAITLAPSEPGLRLNAARILWRAGRRAEALKAIEAALAVASNDEDRRRARELQAAIERDKPQ
jgi:tetratricopeptide (TPR) repeat protein